MTTYSIIALTSSFISILAGKVLGRSSWRGRANYETQILGRTMEDLQRNRSSTQQVKVRNYETCTMQEKSFIDAANSLHIQLSWYF